MPMLPSSYISGSFVLTVKNSSVLTDGSSSLFVVLQLTDVLFDFRILDLQENSGSENGLRFFFKNIFCIFKTF